MFVINNSQQLRTKKLIDINPSNFFEVIDYEPEGNAKVRFTYKILLDGLSRKSEDDNYYLDFGFLDVSLKLLSNINSVSKNLSDHSAKNNTQKSIDAFSVKADESDEVSDKLLMFNNLVSAKAEEDLKIIAKESINFSSEMIDVFKSYYRTVEAEPLANDLSEITRRKTLSSFSTGINTISNFSSYVYNLKDDITNIVDVNVNSAANVGGLTNLNSEQKTLLSTIFNLSNEQKTNIEQEYSIKYVDKQLSYIVVNVDITFKHIVYGSNLLVVAEVRKTENSNNDVYESFNQQINLQEQINAFTKIQNPPHVSFAENKDGNITFTMSMQPSDIQKLQGYNLYVKEINEQLSKSFAFKKIGTTEQNSITVKKPETLSVFRIVPIEYSGNESFIFTNITVGKKDNSAYSKNEKLVISVYQVYNLKEVRIEIDNIPKKDVLVEIYRRDVSDDTVKLVVSTKVDGFFTPSTILPDASIVVGKIFDYYAKVSYIENEKTHICYSEPMLYKHVNTFLNFPIGVSVGDIQNTTVDFRDFLTAGGGSSSYDDAIFNDYSLSFDINVTLEKTELENITDYIKTQAPEFYSQYMDPANNEKFADKQKINYSSIFVHEVHRLNTVTGERFVYPIVGTGTFVDTREIRKHNQISGINPHHDYEYQVFTYKRSPLTLLKNYIISGYDKNGKIWFYSPYKWKNSEVINSGALHAEDENGVYIEKIETFSSECYGLTFKQKINFSVDTVNKSIATLSQVDRNTVYLEWQIQRNLISYDSFLIVKVINGVKSIVSRSKDSFAYVDITENDIGGLRFEIIPISNDFMIFESVTTNYILIQPESVIKPIKVSNMLIGVN